MAKRLTPKMPGVVDTTSGNVSPQKVVADMKKREAQRKKRNAARRAARAKAKDAAAKQAAKTAGRQAAVKTVGRAVPVVGAAMTAGAAGKRVTEDYKKMTNEKPDLSLTPGSAAFSRRMKAIESNIASAKRANDKAAVKSLESRLKKMQAVAPKGQSKVASKPKVGGFAATKKAAPALKTSPAKKKISFKEAFASARKAGKKEFTWNGGRYNTMTKEEADMAKKKATLKKTVAKTGADSRKISEQKKRKAASKYVGPRQEMVDRTLAAKKSYGGGMAKKTVKRQGGGNMAGKPKGVGCATKGYGKAMR